MMVDEQPPVPKFSDPFIERNYNLMFHYLMFLVDAGLDFLKREYISKNSETQFKQFSATSYFNFILRGFIRDKIKNQIRVILHAGVDCAAHFQEDYVDPDVLDEVVQRRLPRYYRNDLTLINTSTTHPGHQELKMISKLTFRIAVIQSTRILICKDAEVKTYDELVRSALPIYEQCRNSVNAMLSMVDQMIDCFENHPDMISIPFYTPIFSVRDFQYVRRVYEYALKTMDEQLELLYFPTGKKNELVLNEKNEPRKEGDQENNEPRKE